MTLIYLVVAFAAGYVFKQYDTEIKQKISEIRGNKDA